MIFPPETVANRQKNSRRESPRKSAISLISLAVSVTIPGLRQQRPQCMHENNKPFEYHGSFKVGLLSLSHAQG
jgi:hypothetical protein